jgi:glutamine amidotransferase
MEASVCVLDYGSGNVKSVTTMLRMVCPNVVVSNTEADIERASHLVLPGVGSFGAAMEKIQHLLPVPLLREQVFDAQKPFLGICVGMQVLASEGCEFGVHAGLGWIPGRVVKLPTSLRLPHIGWNNVSFVPHDPLAADFSKDTDFYFVHSFAFEPADPAVSIARAEYGTQFCCASRRQNIVGVQFHPEKSHRFGMRLLENFARWNPA